MIRATLEGNSVHIRVSLRKLISSDKGIRAWATFVAVRTEVGQA